MKTKQPSVVAMKIFTLARWQYLRGDAGIFKHHEGRDLVLDAIVAIGFWLLVALLFCWLSCS